MIKDETPEEELERLRKMEWALERRIKLQEVAIDEAEVRIKSAIWIGNVEEAGRLASESAARMADIRTLWVLQDGRPTKTYENLSDYIKGE